MSCSTCQQGTTEHISKPEVKPALVFQHIFQCTRVPRPFRRSSCLRQHQKHRAIYKAGSLFSEGRARECSYTHALSTDDSSYKSPPQHFYCVSDETESTLEVESHIRILFLVRSFLLCLFSRFPLHAEEDTQAPSDMPFPTFPARALHFHRSSVSVQPHSTMILLFVYGVTEIIIPQLRLDPRQHLKTVGCQGQKQLSWDNPVSAKKHKNVRGKPKPRYTFQTAEPTITLAVARPEIMRCPGMQIVFETKRFYTSIHLRG